MEFTPSDESLAKRLLRFDPLSTSAQEKALTVFFASMRQGFSYLSLKDREEKNAVYTLSPLLLTKATSLEEITTPLCLWKDYLYLHRQWTLELQLASEIKRVRESPLDKNFLETPLTIITGGPGTGKTYQAKKLVEKFYPLSNKIILTAPTGKAVHRLSIDQIPKMTLHALLQHNEDFLPYDLIIVDECSMVDQEMWLKLFKKVNGGTFLVLLGDPHQLPPVESSGFFSEITSILPKIELKEVMRVENPALLTLSHAIRKEIQPDFTPFLSKEVSLIPYLQKLFSFDFTDPPLPEALFSKLSTLGVLSCFRTKKEGTDMLNQTLAAFFRTKGWPLPIMIRKNDYNLGLTNGQIGILCSEKEALFQEGDSFRKLPALLLPPYDFGYCLSIHKAQGSEYDTVLLLIEEDSTFFGREMLYTAVTRAKRNLKIFGKEEHLNQMLSHTSFQSAPLLRACLS